jgi:hypothetical protein
MPRRHRDQISVQEDVGAPQFIQLQSPIVSDYLKKNYLAMCRESGKTHECSICLEVVGGCEKCFCLLSCGHVFHFSCFIKAGPQCPLCRN